MKKLLLIAVLLIDVNLFAQSTETVLLNDDFGFGPNVALPAGTIATAYCYNDQVSRICPVGADQTNSYFDRLEESQYVVTSRINPLNGTWFDFRDHTSGGLNPDGRFLAINIGSAAGSNGILYSQKIFNVEPNQNLNISANVANLVKPTFPNFVDPALIYEIRTNTGLLIGQVPMTPNTDLIAKTNTWQLRQFSINSGSVVTPYIIFNIRSASTLNSGNDTAIDDIKVTQTTVLKITNSLFDKATIYPNPVSNILNIDNVELDNIAIYNNLGALLKEFKTTNELKNQIDLSDFSKGFYFIKLEKNQNSVLKKIVVN